MASDHDKQFPLGVVPVLSLGNARAADVDRHLTAIGGVYQLGKGTTVVHVHLKGVLKLVRGKIGQVQGVQFLSKGAIGHLGHHERSRLCLELLQ